MQVSIEGRKIRQVNITLETQEDINLFTAIFSALPAKLIDKYGCEPEKYSSLLAHVGCQAHCYPWLEIRAME